MEASSSDSIWSICRSAGFVETSAEKIVAAERADGRVGEQAVKLAFGGAFAADRLHERERIADAPHDECARDDVLLVAREHFRVAGLVDAAAHVEQHRLVDGPRQLPVQARWRRRANRPAEARDEQRACPSRTTTAVA